jgi:hypothetical protein
MNKWLCFLSIVVKLKEDLLFYLYKPLTKTNKMTINLNRIGIYLLIVLALISCQKELRLESPERIAHEFPLPNSTDSKEMTISGIVYGEGEILAGAEVRIGNHVTITDQYGFFRFIDIEVFGDPVVVAQKESFFKLTRLVPLTWDDYAHVEMELTSRELSGSFEARNGGKILQEGVYTLNFQPNSILVKSTKQPYQGTVEVYAAAIQRDQEHFERKSPGSPKVISRTKEVLGVQPESFLVAELYTPQGEELMVQEARGTAVSLQMSSSLNMANTLDVAAWHLNEQTAVWEEKGLWTKHTTGVAANLPGFSWWMVGSPVDFAVLTGQIFAIGESPLSSVNMQVYSPDETIAYTLPVRTGVNGNFSFLIPKNNEAKIMLVTDCGIKRTVGTVRIIDSNVVSRAYHLDNIDTAGLNLRHHKVWTLDCNLRHVDTGWVHFTHEGRYNAASIHNGYYIQTLQECDRTKRQIEVELNYRLSNGSLIVMQTSLKRLFIFGSYILASFPYLQCERSVDSLQQINFNSGNPLLQGPNTASQYPSSQFSWEADPDNGGQKSIVRAYWEDNRSYYEIRLESVPKIGVNKVLSIKRGNNFQVLFKWENITKMDLILKDNPLIPGHWIGHIEGILDLPGNNDLNIKNFGRFVVRK